jgi:outer membrane protein assembly factor BamD
MRREQRKVWGKSVLTAAILVFLSAGCHKESVNFMGMTPEQQYEYAKARFDKRDFSKAKNYFLLTVVNNPGNILIEKAQYYLAETYYNLKEYILAVEEYEKLIRSLPQSPFVDDARYKIGMSYYKLSPGYALDQEYTYKAITHFQLFLEEYPNSELKETVEKQLSECRLKLAKKRYKTGELYRKMGYLRAALISFEAVLESFYDTEYADDALFWKGECHYRMGELVEAEKAFHDLISKHDQSPFTDRAQKRVVEIRDKKNAS